MLAWVRTSALEPRSESGILPVEPPTQYVHYFGDASSGRRVLVIHGLDTSKESMWLIASALADGGFDVYRIDLPGHGDSKEAFRTDLAEKAIRNSRTYLGNETIVLGHSFGAGLLLDLAAADHFSTMVLLAPPPMPLAEINADRVLIATGAIDIPKIRSFVPLAADIGGPRIESWILPWGGHGSGILNPRHIDRIVSWLGEGAGPTRTKNRILWSITMFIAGVAEGIALLPCRKVAVSGTPATQLLARYACCFGLAMFILRFVNPASPLRLFTTDYLIGFLLLAGILLLVAGSDWPRRQAGSSPYVRSVLSAAFVVAVLGFIATSRILHIPLSGGRWWRFPCIVLAGLPMFIADETGVRRLSPRWKSEAAALLTRGLMLAFILTGVLTLNRKAAFLVLITPLITLFWIALWFAAGVVHRHTQNPLAAALFAALVQGWAFAAWFVTI